MRDKHTNTITLRRQRRRGFTLTEIAIVLGIVGLILGAIWVAAAAVYNNLRVSHTNTEILQTAQAVRTLFATQSTFVGAADQTAAMITAGVTPSDMKNAAGTGLTDPWGGEFYVGGTTDLLGVLIELDNVPQSQCIDLVAMVGGSTRDSGLFLAQSAGVGAKGAAFNVVPAILTPLTSSVSPTAAAAVANGSGGTGCVAGVNLVEFGFLLKG